MGWRQVWRPFRSPPEPVSEAVIASVQEAAPEVEAASKNLEAVPEPVPALCQVYVACRCRLIRAVPGVVGGRRG